MSCGVCSLTQISIAKDGSCTLTTLNSSQILILYKPADGKIGDRMQVQNSLQMTSLKDSPERWARSPFLKFTFN